MPEKHALVTGAAGGLGKEICLHLQKQGWTVTGLDLVSGDTASTYALHCVDITDRQQLADLAQSIVCPDLIVNCAGITRDSSCWKMTEADWQAVIAVNLGGAVNVLSAFASAMRDRRSGCVINISSINATRGKFGQSNYVAAKAGLEALTRNWAIELGGRGIRVNAVAPGMVDSRMTRELPAEVLKRAQQERLLPWAPQANDIADCVCFLASDAARCITGQTLVVDSGQLTG